MFIRIEKSFLFEENTAAPSCHASTVLPLNDGRILAAWFAGSQEGARDVGIWTSLYAEGRWSPPARLPGLEETAHWNPVLHLTRDGVILLYFKTGMQISDWRTFRVTSRDGIAWTAPQELVPGDRSGGRGPVKNKCLRTSAGLLLAPASAEPTGKEWFSFVDISHDDGFTWKKCNAMTVPSHEGQAVGLIQPSLWEDIAGVHCLMRSNCGALYRSDSPDGVQWDAPYRTALPNNNAGIDLARDAQGQIWLVYNPVSQNWGPRYPLTLAVSRDGGDSFSDVLVLEEQPGEYSYPAIVAKDSYLYITYTYNRQRIALRKVDVSG